MHKTRLSLAGLCVLSAAVVLLGMLATPVTAAEAPVVRTTDGLVRGGVTGDHRVFQGIPFARPPVGALRLRAPRPAEPWRGVRDATTPGPGCAQVYSYPPGSPPTFSGSEDCLYLNIHVPREARGPLPVMVFLHGGGFTTGSGSAYDPRRVTRTGGVIVVTLNYRLGALGFLRHPSLHDPFAGNFGIADQQAALRWVRHNIAAFGGDAHNVTLWGESAGGFSVCAQLSSPLARGLFDKAIAQSAPCANDFVTRREADRRGHTAVTDLGCGRARDVAACLRDVPVRDIVQLWSDRLLVFRDVADAPWFPVAGTAPIPLQPLPAMRLGLANDVPRIQGATRDEMRYHVALKYDGLGNPVTAKGYPQAVREMFGRDTRHVLGEYPRTDFDTPSIALATALTDEGRMVGTCAQMRYDDATRAPLYTYEFAEPSGEMVNGFPLGAAHGADVPYFFDSYWQKAPEPLRGAKKELADTMIRYWTNFARTGHPGNGWAPHRDGNALSLAVDRITPENVAREHKCRFWHTVD